MFYTRVIGDLANSCRECGGQPGQWCTFASTLQGTQLGGETKIPASPGARMTIHCKASHARAFGELK